MQMGPRAPPNGQSATCRDGDGTSCLVLRYGSEHASGRGFSFPPQVPCISTTDGWLGNVRTRASGSHAFLGGGPESPPGLGEHLVSIW